MNKYIVELNHYEGNGAGQEVPFVDLQEAADYRFSFRGGCVLAQLYQRSSDGINSPIPAHVLDNLEHEYNRKKAIERLNKQIESSERDLKTLIQARKALEKK